MPRMVDWQERQRIVRLHEFEELDRKFVHSENRL